MNVVGFYQLQIQEWENESRCQFFFYYFHNDLDGYVDIGKNSGLFNIPLCLLQESILFLLIKFKFFLLQIIAKSVQIDRSRNGGLATTQDSCEAFIIGEAQHHCLFFIATPPECLLSLLLLRKLSRWDVSEICARDAVASLWQGPCRPAYRLSQEPVVCTSSGQRDSALSLLWVERIAA